MSHPLYADVVNWQQFSNRISISEADYTTLSHLLSPMPIPPFLEVHTDPDLLLPLLSNPTLVNKVLNSPEQLFLSPGLYFFIIMHHVLKEHAIHDPRVTDYSVFVILTALNLSSLVTNEEAQETLQIYFIDFLAHIDRSTYEEQFFLRAHLANYALLYSGFFLDYLQRRERQRGAPNLSYYEGFGATQFSMAKKHPLAEELQLVPIYTLFSHLFSVLRSVFNHVQKEYLN